MKKLYAILAVIVVLVILKSLGGPISLGPDVKAPGEPYQFDLEDAPSFSYEGYTLRPQANFEIKAKVLSRKNYRMGRGSDIAPTDLALGWGRMSDESVTENIRIRQSGRWYRWSTEQFPIPRREIETSSANMHIIPADSVEKRILKKIREGQIVVIKGQLVNVSDGQEGGWKTSTSREDTGDGACEIIYARKIIIIE